VPITRRRHPEQCHQIGDAYANRARVVMPGSQGTEYPGELVGGKPIPCEGYYFRILKAQGSNGSDGAKSYIQSGRMTDGFALIAWPALFALSGIMTFIVGPAGAVYQRDLGAGTAHIAVNDYIRSR
jgi:hypothetical protein